MCGATKAWNRIATSEEKKHFSCRKNSTGIESLETEGTPLPLDECKQKIITVIYYRVQDFMFPLPLRKTLDSTRIFKKMGLQLMRYCGLKRGCCKGFSNKKVCDSQARYSERWRSRPSCAIAALASPLVSGITPPPHTATHRQAIQKGGGATLMRNRWPVISGHPHPPPLPPPYPHNHPSSRQEEFQPTTVPDSLKSVTP